MTAVELAYLWMSRVEALLTLLMSFVSVTSAFLVVTYLVGKTSKGMSVNWAIAE